MINLDGLDVRRLWVLLHSLADQRERDARFYENLHRDECIAEQKRAASDVPLLRGVIARIEASVNAGETKVRR